MMSKIFFLEFGAKANYLALYYMSFILLYYDAVCNITEFEHVVWSMSKVRNCEKMGSIFAII